MWQKAITTGGSTFNWDYQCWIFHPIKPGSTSLIGNDVYNILQNTTGYFETKCVEHHQLLSKFIFSMITVNAVTRWRTSYKIFIFEFNINECQFRLANKIVKPKNILSILRRKLDTYEGYINIRNGRYNENGESNQAWIKYLYIIQQRRIQCKMYFEKG